MSEKEKAKETEKQEPLWAKGKTDRQIRLVCKSLKVPNADKMGRAEMITKCEYLNVYPNIRNAAPEDKKRALRARCSGARHEDTLHPSEEVKGMEEDELVDCIVNGRVARLMAVMGTVSAKQFEAELDKTELSEQDKKSLLKSHRESEAALVDFMNRQKDLDDNTETIVLAIAGNFKTQFSSELTEFFKSFQQLVVNEKPAAKKEGKSWYDTLGEWMWWLLGKGFDLARYILTNPATARITAFIALKVKRRICMEISLYIGLLKYEQNAKFSESAAATLEDIGQNARELLPTIATKFMNGPGFSNLWDSTATIVKAGISGAVKSVPVVGGAIGGIADVVIDGTLAVGKEAAEFAIQVSLYETQVGDTGKYLIELFDVTNCIKRGTVKTGLFGIGSQVAEGVSGE